MGDATGDDSVLDDCLISIKSEEADGKHKFVISLQETIQVGLLYVKISS